MQDNKVCFYFCFYFCVYIYINSRDGHIFFSISVGNWVGHLGHILLGSSGSHSFDCTIRVF